MNLNTQFVFDSKTKRVLIGGMVLGVVSLLFTYLNDDEFHTRFWSSWLLNSVFFSGIAFMSMLFLSTQITAFTGWNAVVKRVLEAMTQFMWVGALLMGLIAAGIWGHFHHLYYWNTPGITDPTSPAYDKVIAGKSGFLNPVWYTLATVGFLVVWYFWAKKLRQASVDQDTKETADFTYYRKQRKWAASYLPLCGVLCNFTLWLAIMSIDPHWYSTMYVWYSMISVWLGSLSLTVLIIIFLKSRGYMEYVTPNHLHNLGMYIFGFSIFWTYLWFSQFMLLWYANIGEETTYFYERMNYYPVLYWINLAVNFLVPFLILMRNDTKRKFGTMAFVAVFVFFGHWWDYFYMIKPGARNAATEARELLEGKHTSMKKDEVAPIPAGTAAQEKQPEAATESHEASPEAGEKSVAEAATVASHENGAEGTAEHGHAEMDETKSFKLGYTVPGLEDVGVLIGFLSLFLFFVFSQMSRVSLVPLKDPFLEESLHHDTGALIEGEAGNSQH